MTKKIQTSLLLVATCFALSGCVTSTGDRAVVGGAIGLGIGAATGNVGGAVAGAAIGAIAGAVTAD